MAKTNTNRRSSRDMRRRGGDEDRTRRVDRRDDDRREDVDGEERVTV